MGALCPAAAAPAPGKGQARGGGRGLEQPWRGRAQLGAAGPARAGESLSFGRGDSPATLLRSPRTAALLVEGGKKVCVLQRRKQLSSARALCV